MFCAHSPRVLLVCAFCTLSHVSPIPFAHLLVGTCFGTITILNASFACVSENLPSWYARAFGTLPPPPYVVVRVFCPTRPVCAHFRNCTPLVCFLVCVLFAPACVLLVCALCRCTYMGAALHPGALWPTWCACRCTLLHGLSLSLSLPGSLHACVGYEICVL